jgi:hypothetical protein
MSEIRHFTVTGTVPIRILEMPLIIRQIGRFLQDFLWLFERQERIRRNIAV